MATKRVDTRVPSGKSRVTTAHRRQNSDLGNHGAAGEELSDREVDFAVGLLYGVSHLSDLSCLAADARNVGRDRVALCSTLLSPATARQGVFSEVFAKRPARQCAGRQADAT
jgi:hypothetical protein